MAGPGIFTPAIGVRFSVRAPSECSRDYIGTSNVGSIPARGLNGSGRLVVGRWKLSLQTSSLMSLSSSWPGHRPLKPATRLGGSRPEVVPRFLWWTNSTLIGWRGC